MEILYLSSLCSVREYEQMFKKYGSTSSHASQKFNRMIVDGLVANGCKVETLSQRIILDSNQRSLPSYSETENKIDYTYLPFYSNKIINRLSTICNAFKFIKTWSRNHPKGIIICDIILGELSIAVYLLSKIMKLNTTAIVTDVPNIRANDDRKGLRAIPAKIKNALIYPYKSFIFLTEKMNDYLNPNKKPYVVIEGLIDRHVLDEPNSLENKYPEKVIMMAGSLEDVYGVGHLLDAFKDIDEPEARLLFYGKGKAVTKIKEYSDLDNRIAYCGELTNRQIVEEEKKSTLLINPRPAIGEWTAFSFPSKNMEYMASGTPLVAFDLPCIPLEYQKYFYHLNEYTVESIRDVLSEILKQSRADIHSYGLSAQKWIVDAKCPSVQMKKYVDMIYSNKIIK